MRTLVTVWAVCWFAVLAGAAPPSVDFPNEIKANSDYVTIRPKTDAKQITYVGLSNTDPFPSAFLKDARDFVLPTRGLANGKYRFAGVASLNDEHTEFRFTVVVGDGKDTPIPPSPGPQPTPPVPPSPALDAPVWIFLVEETAERTPALSLILQDVKFWNGLEGKGYKFRPYDKDSSEAKKRGLDSIKDKDGRTLVYPYLVIADKNGSVVSAHPVPASTAAITPLLPAVRVSAAKVLVGDIADVTREPATVYLEPGCYVDSSGRLVCPQTQQAPARGRGLFSWR